MRTALYVALGLVIASMLVALIVNQRTQAPSARLREREGKPVGGKKIHKTDAEWRAQLTEEQYQVTRKHGTEQAFTGEYANSKDDGIFACVCCGQPLFDAKTKYESGTGWPSFWQPVNEDNVSLKEDRSWLMSRTEVLCSRCDAHLGHVFEDGPQPTGLRYCMNLAALRLEPREGGPPKPKAE